VQTKFAISSPNVIGLSTVYALILKELTPYYVTGEVLFERLRMR
jgi:hypothetical protein